jgi:amino acid transporter
MSDSPQSNGNGKLRLVDACGMAIGGMVGGGIFAVLGEGVTRAGNAAFLSFGLAGLLALVTGVSYARLTLSFDESGGSFVFVEELAGKDAAGTLSWFLILGYIFTLSLYAATFDAYGGRLVGMPQGGGGLLGAGVVAALAAVNLMGVRESGIVEDLLVYGKVAILVLATGVGLTAVKADQALPVIQSGGLTGVVAAGALLFVAYEGFELLTFDYEDIADHHRNLPRAVVISISAVIALYMAIAFVTSATLPDATIQKHSETVLAYVVQPVVGRPGVVAILVAAVLSTASAINATLFATARLAHRVTRDGELPKIVSRWHRGGVPVVFVLFTAVLAMTIQYAGSLHDITSFSSAVFLVVFATVNVAAVIHGSYRGWTRIFPIAGAAGCLVAAVLVVKGLFEESPAVGWVLIGVAVGLLALRVLFVWRQRRSA